MRNSIIEMIDQKFRRTDYPDFRTGDTIRVHWRVREGDKERVQAYEGVVIRMNNGPTASFTVRKISYGVGIERIFPFNSPRYEKIELIQQGRVRRSRLFYLRGLQGKAARVEAQREQQLPKA